MLNFKKNIKIFEGPDYTKYRESFFRKKRIFKNLDLNKVLMADIAPELYTKSKKFYVLFKDLYLIPLNIFKLIINVYLFEYILFEKEKGNRTWFIISSSIRNSYYEEAMMSVRDSSPTVVSWITN